MKKKYCPNCLKVNHIRSKTCFNCKLDLLFNDKYYLIDVLGENSGKTYLAVGANPSAYPRQVVIKELSIKKMKKWKEEELFKRERLALSSLEHKFIPKLIEKIDIKRGKRLNYYTVIEYIDGENLKKYIKIKTLLKMK